jgi:hypothetical protein
MRKAVTIEKQEETGMRLKLLSPGEMSAEQKETYDEAISGKRGAPPAPMMAWLNSPDMARHATRLGEQLRFNTIFPASFPRSRFSLPRGTGPRITNGMRISAWR